MAKDRFLRGNKRDGRAAKIATKARAEARYREKRAFEEREFVCKQCECWYPLSEFEYVHKGDTMIATRCSSCRSAQRRKYAAQRRRTGG